MRQPLACFSHGRLLLACHREEGFAPGLCLDGDGVVHTKIALQQMGANAHLTIEFARQTAGVQKTPAALGCTMEWTSQLNPLDQMN
jgi:hypothetical protein